MSPIARQLVDQLIEQLQDDGWLSSPAVAEAFRRVPRHRLIPLYYQGRADLPLVTRVDPTNPDHLARVYDAHRALTIHLPERSVASQPTLLALVLERADLGAGMRVLEIGAGSGYNAALIAEIVGPSGAVTTIDITPDLVTRTHRLLHEAGYTELQVLARDGFLGCPERAPFDRILASVGCMDLSPRWVEQLAPGGSILLPLMHGSRAICPLTHIEVQDGRLVGRIRAFSNFMNVHGELDSPLWPNDRVVRDLERRAKQHPPDVVHPLWDGLRHRPDATPRPGEEWEARLEFFYFLALNAPRAFACWGGPGLLDGDSFVMAGETKIVGVGPRADELLAALHQQYEQWVALGRPRMLDYAHEFLPIDTPLPHPLPPTSWVIERKFYRQMIRHAPLMGGDHG